MSDQKPSLLVERDGHVAIITINDAPWNRMTLDFIDQLEVIIPELGADTSVRAIIIRGAQEEHFSVGMNLKQFPEGVRAKGSPDAMFDQRLHVLGMIENLNKPVIAVMCGYCLGGGLELPLACHFRFAAEEGTKMGLPEMDLGTVPAWGGSARLTRCVGRAHSLDMILRGKKISGPRALEIGLVNEVWPNDQLQQKALELAHELSKQPPLAIAGVLNAVIEGEFIPLEESLQLERKAVHKTNGTKHQQEGMMAFIQKREPDFSSDPA